MDTSRNSDCHQKAGLTGFIKDWGGVGAAVAILLFALAKWEAYVEFRTNTNSRLTNIEKILEGIQGSLTKQNIVNYSTLPLKDFKATLPDLSSSIATAKQKNVKVSPQIIGDLQEKLTASVDAPNFWPTAAEFISYRSFNNTSWLAPPNLPTCTDSPPAPATTIESQSPTQLTVTPARYENCRFTLDSPQENLRFNAVLLLLGAPGVTFKHCIIVYRGGPIELILSIDQPNVHYTLGSREHPLGTGMADVKIPHTITFSDCLFDIALKDVPPERGRELTTVLLASTGSTTVIRLATHS